MKKVRIYSLKQGWGLASCTDILAACKHLGIPAKTASSSIHPNRVAQVRDWLADPANCELIPSNTLLEIDPQSPKSSSAKKSRPRKDTRPPSDVTPQATKQSKKRGKKSRKSQPLASHAPEVPTPSFLEDTSFDNSSFTNHSAIYANGNRNFRLTVTGVKQQRIRNGLTHLKVPFDRLTQEVQRLHRMEAKILDITPIAPRP